MNVSWDAYFFTLVDNLIMLVCQIRSSYGYIMECTWYILKVLQELWRCLACLMHCNTNILSHWWTANRHKMYPRYHLSQAILLSAHGSCCYITHTTKLYQFDYHLCDKYRENFNVGNLAGDEVVLAIFISAHAAHLHTGLEGPYGTISFNINRYLQHISHIFPFTKAFIWICQLDSHDKCFL